MVNEAQLINKTKVFFNEFPSDWKVFSLEQILDKIRNGASEKQNNKREGVPVTRIETISNGEINYDKVGYINTDKDIDNFKLVKGDILLSNINSLRHIGKSAQYKGQRVLYHGMNLLLLRPNNLVDNRYLFILLNSHPVKKYFQANAKQAINQASINQSDVKSLVAPFPPLKEQQKIASILSSVDEAIGKTEQIIEQTGQVKKGMMQQLLTKGIGHTEFKNSPAGEIPSVWNVVTIGDIANEKREKNINEEVDLVLSCTKYDGIVSSLEYFKKKVYSKNTSNYKILKEGQFAYATIHLDEGSIGVLENFDIGIISPMYTIFETNDKVNNRFLYYLLKSDKYINRYQNLGQGSINRRQSIPFKTLKDLEIQLPPLEEQNKIVEIIKRIDGRVKKEKQKGESLNDVKHGLMQQLLTGQVRVPIDDDEEVTT